MPYRPKVKRRRLSFTNVTGQTISKKPHKFLAYNPPVHSGPIDLEITEEDPFFNYSNLKNMTQGEQNTLLCLRRSIEKEIKFSYLLMKLGKETDNNPELHSEVLQEITYSSQRLEGLRNLLRNNISKMKEKYMHYHFTFPHLMSYLQVLVACKLNFLFMGECTAVAMSSGLNVAYFLTYAFFSFIIEMPATFLEILIGQYSKHYAVYSWKFCTVLSAMGYTALAGIALGFIRNFWRYGPTMIYLIQSILNAKPWEKCQNTNEKCYTKATTETKGLTCNMLPMDDALNIQFYASEVVYYRNLLKERFFLIMSTPDMTGMFCSIFARIICLLLLFRSLPTYAKIVYWISIINTCCLFIILMIVLWTVSGALNSMASFFAPEFSKLNTSILFQIILNCLQYSMMSTNVLAAHAPVFSEPYKAAFMKVGLQLTYMFLFMMLTYTAADMNKIQFQMPDYSCFSEATLLVQAIIPNLISKCGFPYLTNIIYFTCFLISGINSVTLCGYILNMSLLEITPTLYNNKKTFLAIFLITSMAIDFFLHLSFDKEMILKISMTENWFFRYLSLFLAIIMQTEMIFIYSVTRLFDDIQYLIQKRPSAKWNVAIHIGYFLSLALTIVMAATQQLEMIKHSKAVPVVFFSILLCPIILDNMITTIKSLLKTGKITVQIINHEWGIHDEAKRKKRSLYRPRQRAYTEDRCFHFCLQKNRELEFDDDREAAIMHLQLAKFALKE